PEGDPSEDPYVTTVRDGLDYMFTTLSTESIPVQTSGDPDINGNGYGIRVNEGSYPYQGGMVIDMIIGSGTPLRYVRTSHNSYQVIRGQRYADIVQDMAESYIYGQQDSGSTLGGWRYGWNGGNDNSAAQWAAIGLIPAERIFGAQIPSWVYTNNLTILANTQDQRYGQLGYTGTAGTWGDASTTASGMVMMAMDDFDREDGRWIKAANRLRQHWDTPSGNDSLRNNYYAMFATSKAMRLANPSRIEQMCLGCAETSIDWYGDETVGLARSIMDQQLADGHWVHPSGLSGTGYWQYGLTTAWATLILTRELFEVAPVADAGRDRVWGISRVGDPRPLTLVGSGSFHPDPFRTIVLYEWDVDGDGLFDTSSTDPNTVTEYLEADYPVPTLPRSITVTLRVTDDAGKTDTDTAVILLAEPPHPPIADAGPPGTPPGTGYTCTLGIPCVLDASDSFEIDPTDFIARWEWELDGVGIPDFDEATGEVISYTFNTEGTFNIGVRVWDDGRFNDLNGDDVVDENERLSDQEFTTVDVEPNLPPVAVAADMTVEEGQTFNHDGSGSSDPNGDPLTYAWDLDNDGNYDNATGVAPSQVFPADGVYTVGLQVSDSLLTDETTATITVTDRGPTAAFDWAPEPQEEGTAVSFGDLSTSSPDTIVAWAWDFDGLGASSDQHPSFTFDDDGTYTVTLTVTDSDGSVDSVSHDVTITDRAPTAAFTWAPEPSVEGSPVAFTDTSTSSPDAIVSWAWDFAGLGSSAAQNPSFAFPDNGVYTVSLTVTDDDGSTNTTTHDVTVLNANPVVNAGLDQTTGEGSTVSLDPATFTDAGTADTHTATVDWGDGSGPQAATVNQGAGSGSVPGSHVYTDGGVYTVTVTVTDDDGGVGSDTMIVTVGNAGAQVDAGPDQTINEGETASLAPATFTYIGLTDTHTATINWGDGMTSAGTVSEAGGSGSVSGSHTYVDDGVYTVTVTVTDDDGGVGSDSLTVTVLNLPPVVEAGPDQSTSENTTISLAPATFTDAGTADTHTATVDWGDGSGPQPAAVTQGSGSGTVASSHAYTTGGTYTVTVTVTDDDGGVGIDTLTVNVDGGNPPEQTIFDLIARAKPEKIDLVWAPVNGADAYNVYRSTTAGGPYALIAAGHTCTYCAFADSGLTNGVTYFYVVTSITGGQESLSSNEASATPQVTTRRRR
ncbi:MAG: PKD domain-containing protein, partial [Rhodobacterales bacterium]|nr:PKD domain-containing protein [Rhodobacterales bacterium]